MLKKFKLVMDSVLKIRSANLCFMFVFLALACTDQEAVPTEPAVKMDSMNTSKSPEIRSPQDTSAIAGKKDSVLPMPGLKNRSTSRPNPRWRLVLSSQPTSDRAERFAERLGNAEAEVIYVDYLDTYRVVYQSFDDLREAQGQFQKVQQDYPEAWLVFY